MTPGEAEALGADGEPVATLASLDDALISTIATFMRPEAIAHVAACSKPLRRVCADDALWSGLLERHFGAGAAAGAGQMGARLAFGRAVVLRRWHLDARTPAADADTPSTPENRAVNLLTRRVQAMRMSLTPDERKALRHLDLNMDVCSPSPARPLRDASFDHILRKRLARDLFELVTRPADGLTAFPASEDMLEWHATVPGRAGYADEGRTFQLVLLFGAAAVRDGGAASGAEGAALLPRVRVVHPVALSHANVAPDGRVCEEALRCRCRATDSVRAILLRVQRLLDTPHFGVPPLNEDATLAWLEASGRVSIVPAAAAPADAPGAREPGKGGGGADAVMAGLDAGGAGGVLRASRGSGGLGGSPSLLYRQPTA